MMLTSSQEDYFQSYKASFRLEDSPVESKEVFENKKALLAISVGQPYHEKGKLMATIGLINKFPFNQCDIMVGDTLQRYNYYGKMSEQEARNYCYQQGDSWLNRNALILEKLAVPHLVMRWDELLGHQEYEKYKNKIIDVYQNDFSYKTALYSNAEKYLDRLKELNPESDRDSLLSFGLGYLLEEAPVIMPLWAEMGYDYIIYPKPLTIGMAKTRELFVSKKINDKCQWLSDIGADFWTKKRYF